MLNMSYFNVVILTLKYVRSSTTHCIIKFW